MPSVHAGTAGALCVSEPRGRAAESFAKEMDMKTSLIVGAAALLLAGAASAQLKFDKDGDGALSLDEFRAARDAQVEQRFAQLDVNHDGKLTPD